MDACYFVGPAENETDFHWMLLAMNIKQERQMER